MNEYQKELKRKNIKEFIDQHGYAPKFEQINELRDIALKKYTNLENYGFSGFELKKFGFQEPVSCEKENLNREIVFRDLSAQRSSIHLLSEDIENTFQYLNKDTERMSSFLDKLESRVNRLVLLNSKADLFLYGIEETLDTLDFIDMKKTTCHVEKGYATLSKESLTPISNNKYSISARINSNKSTIGNIKFSTPRSLSRKDGTYYKHIVETRNVDQEVKLILEYTFKEETYVGEVKVCGNSVESNSKTYYKVYYSTALEKPTLIRPERRRFSSGENYTSVGKTVKSFKIEIIKNKADVVDYSANKFQFIFCLDSIEFTENQYKKNSTSELYAGPYYVIDEQAKPVNFSMATIASNTCCIVPQKTSVSFYLSKDNENWYGSEFVPNQQSEIVKFSAMNDLSILNKIDESKSYFDFIYDQLLTDDNYEECLINFYIENEDMDKINIKNVRIERNLKQDNILYDSKGGWSYDSSTSLYSCGIYVDSIEGKIINFGPTNCIIDGKNVSGVVRLDEGYHLFQTSSANWKDVDPNLTTAKFLQERDDLYPYNHKYLIEGYNYSNSFSGDKVYLPLGRTFASLLDYVPIEVFNMESNKDNLNIFTIDTIDNRCYFKVKILNYDSSWNKERNNAIIQTQLDVSNTLYVKAIVKSSDEGISPHINSFSVRVI